MSSTLPVQCSRTVQSRQSDHLNKTDGLGTPCGQVTVRACQSIVKASLLKPGCSGSRVLPNRPDHGHAMGSRGVVDRLRSHVSGVNQMLGG